MPSFFTLLAPIALLLPLGAVDLSGRAGEPALPDEPWHEGPEVAVHPISGSVGIATPFSAMMDDQSANQVRIERRVILRVSPRSAPARSNMLAELPRAPLASRVVERKVGKCLDFSDIAGVQADRGNRLVLYMRDQRLIAADLEKSCSARDFYSGFYLEPSKDGRLCVDRDRLQSRSGAKCQVSRLRQLAFEGE